MMLAYQLGLISEQEWLILRTHIDLLGMPDPDELACLMTNQERQDAFNEAQQKKLEGEK